VHPTRAAGVTRQDSYPVVRIGPDSVLEHGEDTSAYTQTYASIVMKRDAEHVTDLLEGRSIVPSRCRPALVRARVARPQAYVPATDVDEVLAATKLHFATASGHTHPSGWVLTNPRTVRARGSDGNDDDDDDDDDTEQFEVLFDARHWPLAYRVGALELENLVDEGRVSYEPSTAQTIVQRHAPSGSTVFSNASLPSHILSSRPCEDGATVEDERTTVCVNGKCQVSDRSCGHSGPDFSETHPASSKTHRPSTTTITPVDSGTPVHTSRTSTPVHTRSTSTPVHTSRTSTPVRNTEPALPPGSKNVTTSSTQVGVTGMGGRRLTARAFLKQYELW
jgi:hypothetical protein